MAVHCLAGLGRTGTSYLISQISDLPIPSHPFPSLSTNVHYLSILVVVSWYIYSSQVKMLANGNATSVSVAEGCIH